MKTNRPAFRCGCLILASALLGVSPAAVRGQETTAANTSAAVISSVALTQDPQRAAVRIAGAGKLDVHAARMQNPERLVLDFAGARMNVQKNTIPGVSAPVQAVRMAQYRPDTARVVIDLTASAPYQIAHEGGSVVVYLEKMSQPTDAPVIAPVSLVRRSGSELDTASASFCAPPGAAAVVASEARITGTAAATSFCATASFTPIARASADTIWGVRNCEIRLTRLIAMGVSPFRRLSASSAGPHRKSFADGASPGSRLSGELRRSLSARRRKT